MNPKEMTNEQLVEAISRKKWTSIGSYYTYEGQRGLCLEEDELLRRLGEADALRKENVELKEKVYFFARTFRYYAGEAFRFYEKHPLARETDETRAANTTKESEASHE